MKNASIKARLTPGARRGHVLIWSMLCMTAFCGVVSLGVDYAHVQDVKTELQRCSDATARGALALYEQYGSATAIANAALIPGYNTVDAPGGQTADVVITWGWWDPVGKTFYTGTQGTGSLTAVKVTSTRTAANNKAVPLTFGKLIGVNGCDVKTSAIAALQPQTTQNITIDARGDLWLAGMPATSSSQASYNDNGSQTNGIPTPISVTPGSFITFTAPAGSSSNNNNNNNNNNWGNGNNINWNNLWNLLNNWNNGGSSSSSSSSSSGGVTGSVDHGDGSLSDGPNGETSNIYTHMMDSPDGNHNGVQNGIGDIRTPLDSMIGVFLDANRPDSTSAPSTVRDYGTQASRDVATTNDLQLKQPFFVGDGQTSTATVKQFRVPAGATRLYLSTMDGYEWNNNHGSFTAQMQVSQQIIMVQ